MPRLIDGDELYQKVVGYNGGAVDKTVAKRLIDQMPTVNHADVVSRKTFEQIKWERDTAVKQLEELGYGLGEKIRSCKTCRYNYLEWHEEPCDSCTSGGESNHWKPSAQTTQNNRVNSNNTLDTISRQAAIDAAKEELDNGTFYDIPSKIEYLPSAEPEREKGAWIPCSERLPEDLEEVNVTWVNHDPEPYYNFVKDKPFTATAVYYKEKWYWYSSTCADLLGEYGRNPNQEIDDGIEIIAWMPLPEPYKEDNNG